MLRNMGVLAGTPSARLADLPPKARTMSRADDVPDSQRFRAMLMPGWCGTGNKMPNLTRAQLSKSWSGRTWYFSRKQAINRR